MTSKRLLLVLLLPFLLAGVLCLALDRGLIWFNAPSVIEYPVRGVDVSHHQGVMDWPRLKAQNIAFAYLKATEGRDFTDPRFSENWQQARSAGLKVGAYHFYRCNRSGAEQAAHFIESVPALDDALPPVLDMECPVVAQADKRNAVRAELLTFLSLLEEHYGKRPVVYATYETYDAYVKGLSYDYSLWIRSVFTAPDLPDGVEWVLWQYNPRGRLEGYGGPETFIDLNVFNGDAEAFVAFAAGRG